MYSLTNLSLEKYKEFADFKERYDYIDLVNKFEEVGVNLKEANFVYVKNLLGKSIDFPDNYFKTPSIIAFFEDHLYYGIKNMDGTITITKTRYEHVTRLELITTEENHTLTLNISGLAPIKLDALSDGGNVGSNQRKHIELINKIMLHI